MMGKLLLIGSMIGTMFVIGIIQLQLVYDQVVFGFPTHPPTGERAA